MNRVLFNCMPYEASTMNPTAPFVLFRMHLSTVGLYGVCLLVTLLMTVVKMSLLIIVCHLMSLM